MVARLTNTLTLVEDYKEDFEQQLRDSREAFLDFYPEI